MLFRRSIQGNRMCTHLIQEYLRLSLVLPRRYVQVMYLRMLLCLRSLQFHQQGSLIRLNRFLLIRLLVHV